MRKQPFALLYLVLFLAVAGCATTEKIYTTTGEKNLQIEFKGLADSFTEKQASYLYVYDVDPRCQVDYLGYVSLDSPSIKIGIPTGKLLLLTVEFVTAERFSGSGIRNQYSYLLKPRSGYDYLADVQNTEKRYKFALMERHRGSGAKRVIERKGLDSCVPGSRLTPDP